jgi:hypothetical protein
LDVARQEEESGYERMVRKVEGRARACDGESTWNGIEGLVLDGCGDRQGSIRHAKNWGRVRLRNRNSSKSDVQQVEWMHDEEAWIVTVSESQR